MKQMISKLIEQLNNKNRLCDGIIVLDFPESERIQLLSELEAAKIHKDILDELDDLKLINLKVYMNKLAKEQK